MPSGVKREKEVARRLQFDGLYLAKQPEDDDIKAPQRPKGHVRRRREAGRERTTVSREKKGGQRVRASRQKGLLHRVHHPHPGHHPRHRLFLHAYRYCRAYSLLQPGGDAGEVKREREVARRIGFDRLYLAEQPENDNIKARYWDKFVKKRARAEAFPGGVISARSFPAQYWDKFVKKCMRQGGLGRERRKRWRVCARRRKGLLPRVHHPHTGHHPCHHLFLHANRLLQLEGDAEKVKREGEVARTIGFHRLYLAEQLEDDNSKGHWDRLFISAKSFPAQYWDKIVKKRVRQRRQRLLSTAGTCPQSPRAAPRNAWKRRKVRLLPVD
jgi:hypothetical protein